jgi:glucosylceramidase
MNASKILLATESCNCPGVAAGKDAWFRAQRYAHDIMADLNHWAHGWVDWNLILDDQGGPNHLNNTCDAPIIMTQAGDNFRLQPMYFFIKHFSHFILPGSKRIAMDLRVQYDRPGQDPALFPQYPVGLYNCDGSSRQIVSRTSDSKIKIDHSDFCLDVVSEMYGEDKIELVKCMWTSHQWDFTHDDTIEYREPIESRVAGGSRRCLSVVHGSMENGAAVTLDPCVPEAAYQKWTFDGTSICTCISIPIYLSIVSNLSIFLSIVSNLSIYICISFE